MPGAAPAGFEAELEAAAADAPPAAAAAAAKEGDARAGGAGPARADGGVPRAPPGDAAAPSPAPEEKPPLTAKAAKAGKAGRKCALAPMPCSEPALTGSWASTISFQGRSDRVRRIWC